jgi:hypothetical protein
MTSPSIRPSGSHPRPLPSTQPQPPTHYEPSGFMPEPQILDSERRQGSAMLLVTISAGVSESDFGTAPPCGRFLCPPGGGVAQ